MIGKYLSRLGAALSGLIQTVRESQVWNSIFRHGPPTTPRNQMLAVASNVFLHLHPSKVRKSGIELRYTWCMGGLSFFIFIVEVITGLLLMFYYRQTIQYAYTDIMDMREQLPLGIMREIHRWGAHANHLPELFGGHFEPSSMGGGRIDPVISSHVGTTWFGITVTM